MLGTRLDVSEDMEAPDPEDPTAPEYALYELLGQLQYLMVEVLAAGLPDEGRPEGRCRPGTLTGAVGRWRQPPKGRSDPSANLQKP